MWIAINPINFNIIVIIESKVSDKDIIIKGNDGGSTITAATFDMSDAGQLILPGGINFPDTQVASSDDNTLDDYEEGTWTPAYTSTGATITNGSTNGGAYTKIGRMVTISGNCATGGSMSGGTAGNTVSITLPFTAASDGTGQDMRGRFIVGPSVSAYSWGGDIPSTAQIEQGNASAVLYYRDAVDSYVLNLRFDDLEDTASNPRNPSFFGGTYMTA